MTGVVVIERARNCFETSPGRVAQNRRLSRGSLYAVIRLALIGGETAPISQGPSAPRKQIFCFALLCSSFELLCFTISISKIKMAESSPEGSLTVFWKRPVAPPNPERFAAGTGPTGGFWMAPGNTYFSLGPPFRN
jgi:hypothetical protein